MTVPRVVALNCPAPSGVFFEQGLWRLKFYIDQLKLYGCQIKSAFFNFKENLTLKCTGLGFFLVFLFHVVIEWWDSHKHEWRNKLFSAPACCLLHLKLISWSLDSRCLLIKHQVSLIGRLHSVYCSIESVLSHQNHLCYYQCKYWAFTAQKAHSSWVLTCTDYRQLQSLISCRDFNFNKLIRQKSEFSTL